MSRFSITDLNRKRYIKSGVTAVPGGGKITPIPSASPSPKPNVDYSRFVGDKSNVGVSSNVYDIINGDFAEVDLGIVYSNGYRYRYLEFKGTEAGGCQIILPAVTVIQQEVDDNGATYLEEVTLSSETIITAYNGNAVVPQLPAPNTTSCISPIPGKVPHQPANINC